jgi:proteic killer suppression protein
MIISFKCADTESLFKTGRTKRFANIKSIAERKLTQLEVAVSLASLKAPPGNRLEALHGNRKGQHSIRVNDQWRVCFIWTTKGPINVEIVDYH